MIPGLNAPLKATRHERPMPGSGSQSQLYECSNGKSYVLKLIGNPQGNKALATEYIAGRLCELVGLRTPDFAIVDVEQSMVPMNSNLQPGPAWGSLYNPSAQNFIPGLYSAYKDPEEICLLIAFDYWTFNWDRANHPQNLMTTASAEGTSLLVIDHSICFCAPLWQHPWTVQSMKTSRDVIHYDYHGPVFDDLKQFVRGTDPFASAVSRIQSVGLLNIEAIVQEIPVTWGLTDEEASMLPEFLHHRSSLLPQVLQNQKSYFTGWK